MTPMKYQGYAARTVTDDWPAAQRLPLMHAVQQALVATCAVPPDDCFVTLQAQPAEQFLFHPHFGGVQRSAQRVLAEVLLLGGRSAGQKRAFYAEAQRRTEALGLRGDDLMIALGENQAIDWSLGAGRAYADAAHPVEASPSI